MPGLENILEKIEYDAKSTADEILAGAKARAEAMVKDAENASSLKIEKAKADFSEDAALWEKRTETAAALEHKKILLQAKQSLIEEAFQKAKEALVSLSEEKKSDLLKQLIIFGADGEMTLQVSKADISLITPSFLEDVQLTLGDKARVTLLDSPADISGGVLLCGKASDVNLSYEAILTSLSSEIEGEIAAVLFQGVKEG